MPGDPFYCSAGWKAIRKKQLSLHPLCQVCKQPATDVDHKTSINNGGAKRDMSNLESLCHKCHSRKTYYVEVLGMKGIPVKDVDPKTGCPLDPNHWWNDAPRDR